jgi:hypothetical protein
MGEMMAALDCVPLAIPFPLTPTGLARKRDGAELRHEIAMRRHAHQLGSTQLIRGTTQFDIDI